MVGMKPPEGSDIDIDSIELSRRAFLALAKAYAPGPAYLIPSFRLLGCVLARVSRSFMSLALYVWMCPHSRTHREGQARLSRQRISAG